MKEWSSVFYNDGRPLQDDKGGRGGETPTGEGVREGEPLQPGKFSHPGGGPTLVKGGGVIPQGPHSAAGRLFVLVV